MANRPKPTHIKLLEGNRGKRAINKNQPKPVGDLFEPPDFLTTEQKAGWAYVIAHSPAGLLKKLDKTALTSYVIAEDLFRQAVIALNESGLVVDSPVQGTPMQNPYLAILNKQSLIMLRTQAELGFTPASRSKITVARPESDENSFNDF